MKRLLSLCLISCFVFMTIPAFAAWTDWEIGTKFVEGGTGYNTSADISGLGAGVEIYGVKCIAVADTAWVSIHDSTTVASAADTNIIDEASAASQYEDSFEPLPHPIKVSSGTTAIMMDCHALVYYRP